MPSHGGPARARNGTSPEPGSIIGGQGEITSLARTLGKAGASRSAGATGPFVAGKNVMDAAHRMVRGFREPAPELLREVGGAAGAKAERNQSARGSG
jgi:hypothetical protein